MRPRLTIEPLSQALHLKIHQHYKDRQAAELALDGNFSIWFTEKTAGKAGYLGVNGFTEYPFGVAGSTPAGMAYGGGNAA